LPYLFAAATFMAAAQAFPTRQVPHRRLPPLGRHAIVALVLILLAAAAVRLYALGSLPSGTWWDEADIGLVARRMLAEANFRPFFVVSNDHPLHHFALVALAFRVFGESTAAVRLISALFGILAILAAFLAGRLRFVDITRVVDRVAQREATFSHPLGSLDDALAADVRGRAKARELIGDFPAPDSRLR